MPHKSSAHFNSYLILINETLIHDLCGRFSTNKIPSGYHISLCLLAMMCFWSDSILFLDVSAAAPLPGCLFSSRSQCDGSLYVSDMEQMRAEELCRPEGGSRWWEASRYLLLNVLTLSSCRADALLEKSHFHKVIILFDPLMLSKSILCDCLWKTYFNPITPEGDTETQTFSNAVTFWPLTRSMSFQHNLLEWHRSF